MHNNRLLTLPPAIALAKQLRELNVEGNRLYLLPSELGKLENLEILLVARNKLRTIPIELTNCKKLRILDVSNNFLQVSSLPLFKRVFVAKRTVVYFRSFLVSFLPWKAP